MDSSEYRINKMQVRMNFNVLLNIFSDFFIYLIFDHYTYDAYNISFTQDVHNLLRPMCKNINKVFFLIHRSMNSS